MRLMLYDNTCTTAGRLPIGLTHSWMIGGRLYGATGALNQWYGASSWEEGLEWISRHDTIDEIQFWGHGNWGKVLIDRQPLDISALSPSHPLHPVLRRIRERMNPHAQWWFRTCDTFGANIGHAFATEWSGWFQRPVAGHTHIIGVWQSGLHRIEPGATPHWHAEEGLREGSPARPTLSTWSTYGAPNTIHCLQSRVPTGW